MMTRVFLCVHQTTGKKVWQIAGFVWVYQASLLWMFVWIFRETSLLTHDMSREKLCVERVVFLSV